MLIGSINSGDKLLKILHTAVHLHDDLMVKLKCKESGCSVDFLVDRAILLILLAGDEC